MVKTRWEIGRVGQPRGLGGDVRARLVRDEPLYLQPGRVLLETEGDRARKVRVKERKGPSVVLHIEGIDTREAAETIHGARLLVESSWFTTELPPEALVGARVVHADTAVLLGEISDFYDNGAQVLLELGRGETKHLVPYVEAFFVQVTPGSPPTLRLRPIPGLLDDAV